MANSIGVNGITVQTQQELIDYFTAQYQSIYGPDINLGQDTPDGQMMMIFIQSILDLQDLVVQVFNSMDPDNAIGVILDQRVAINGIARQAGTFTITPITITVDRALTLFGLDQDVQPVFTVKDSVGTEWQLQETINIPSASANILNFKAAVAGATLTTPNTITLPVTVVLGVTSINNPSSYTILGANEESDMSLKIRRQQSVSISSQGYLQGLLAALDNIEGMDSAFVHENVTGSTDVDGIPSHSIWVIVSGTADSASIANVIYRKRNAGCGLKGTQTYDITQFDGTIFTVRWDNVTPIDLHIKFDVSSLDGVNPPNTSAILDYLVNNFKPRVYEQVNINDLATLVQIADSNSLVTNAGFNLTGIGTFYNSLLPASKDQQFIVTAINISITVV